MAKMTRAKCLAEFFECSGVSHVFWVPAVLMETLDELGRGNRVSRIMAHGEKAAVYMADGYARVSGRPYVVDVASGGADQAPTAYIGGDR